MTDRKLLIKASNKRGFQGKKVAGRGLLYSGFVGQLVQRLIDKEWQTTKFPS